MQWRWLVLLVVAAQTSASEIERAEITFEGGAYHYLFVIKVDGGIDAIRRVTTDYAHLDRINDNVVESRLVEAFDESHFKRRLRLKYRILIFYFDLIFVERVEHLPNGDVVTDIIPTESSFTRGSSRWRLESISERETQITVEADQTPKFWIPPLIGPLVIKRIFLDEVRQTGEKIEQAVRRADV